VLIAIPNCQGRVSPVFDTAARLLVVRRYRGRLVERKEFVLGVLALDALARSVAELHVDVLLCAAISEPLRLALERGGVRVEPHLCGEVEALLAAFCAGHWRRSEFRMPGCWESHGRRIRARHGSSAHVVEENRTEGVR
jgi:predicted Fe-Mo cluster-binding NifX family protein